MDEVMTICCQALEKAGYEVYGYSECYQKFTVRTDKDDIVIKFDDED